MVPLQPRPISRQSTASVTSNQTQPTGPTRPPSQQQQQQQQEHTFKIHTDARTLATAAKYQSQQRETSLARLEQQLGSILTGVPPHMMGQGMPFGPRPASQMGGYPIATPSVSARASPMPDAGAEPVVVSRQVGANDLELRRLLRENEACSLEEIAQRFQKDEGTSKVEKLKQIFGMLWLARHVRSVEGQTIPRVSVYNEYQYSCGDFRLPTLNSASFGKLVRILFPKIATRRLGVRGSSKYHYVGLTLTVDKIRSDKSRMQTPSLPQETSNQSVLSKRAISRQSLPADHTIFGPPAPIPAQPVDASIRHAASATFYPPPVEGLTPAGIPQEANILPRPLKFPESYDALTSKTFEFELPDITPYLPPGTDEDAANSLVSVYRSHCHLAIDNFRFCKTMKFNETYRTLIGLLPVPGQKLLASPSIAPWIRECDWRKYKAMIPMLNMILLTQVPQKAIEHMQDVARDLCVWIQLYFNNQPAHLLSAVIGPASVFVCILERFCRIQSVASQVAAVFDSQEKRNALWIDWVLYSNPMHILQNSLAGRGHRRCRLILTKEIQFLLDPTSGPDLAGTLFELDEENRTEFFIQESQKPARKTSSEFIATLFRFLISIRGRFPAATAKETISTIECLTSTALRNMTLFGASTVASWWTLKCFIDEASFWLAEMGGMFDNDSEVLVPPTPNLADETLYDFGGFDADGSRPGTAGHGTSVFNSPDPDFSNAQANSNGELSRPVSTAPVLNAGLRGASTQKQSALHDDSGIGLDMDDGFGIDHRFSGFVAQSINSDPVDVVVC